MRSINCFVHKLQSVIKVCNEHNVARLGRGYKIEQRSHFRQTTQCHETSLAIMTSTAMTTLGPRQESGEDKKGGSESKEERSREQAKKQSP